MITREHYTLDMTVHHHSPLHFFVLFLSANASKGYANAVAKTQRIWGPYLESIMKVLCFSKLFQQQPPRSVIGL